MLYIGDILTANELHKLSELQYEEQMPIDRHSSIENTQDIMTNLISSRKRKIEQLKDEIKNIKFAFSLIEKRSENFKQTKIIEKE